MSDDYEQHLENLYHDVVSFSNELDKESDRGMALVAIAWIDDKLAQTLLAFFSDGKASHELIQGGDAPLGTFSSRIKCCRALCLIDDYEFHEINLLRKIRNEFAHAKQGLSFETEKIKAYCSSLKSASPEDHSGARLAFKNSVMGIAGGMLYRPVWARKERRQSRSWETACSRTWRKTKDSMPKEGQRVLASHPDGTIRFAVCRNGRLIFE